LSQATCYNNYT